MAGEYGKEFLGTGFGFPFGVHEVTGRFRMSSAEDNIRESVQVILMTEKGERAMRPEFGCGLKKYVYETMDYGILVRIEDEVKTALERWEPRITDVDVQAVPSEGEENQIQIKISCRIRSTNSPYNMVFPFYLQEGFV